MVLLVYYDISDNKKRLKLSKKLIYLGFERIQKSVFAIEAKKHDEVLQLWHRLKEIPMEQDSLHCVKVSNEQFKNMLFCGTPPDFNWICNELPFNIF